MTVALPSSRAPVAGAIVLALCLGPAAGAQEPAPAAPRTVVVSYDNGRMTVLADSVSLRTIIQEWARVGGVRLVGPQHVTPTPVSVDLRNLPEGAALKVLLRSVPGYLLQQRAVESGGPSEFERLVVMAPARSAGVALTAATGPGGSTALSGDSEFEAPSLADDPSSPQPGPAPSADGAFVEQQGRPPSAAPRTVAAPGPARPGLTAPGPVLPPRAPSSVRQ
jgi:hypothetical protein